MKIRYNLQLLINKTRSQIRRIRVQKSSLNPQPTKSLKKTKSK